MCSGIFHSVLIVCIGDKTRNKLSQFFMIRLLPWLIFVAFVTRRSPVGCDGVSHYVEPTPNIWCLDLHDGLIVAGCSDGTVEFWDSTKGTLKYIHKSTRGEAGIATIQLSGKR